MTSWGYLPTDESEHDHDGDCTEPGCTVAAGECCPHCSGWHLREVVDK